MRRVSLFGLLAVAMTTLVLAMLGGLLRFGWPLPLVALAVGGLHGPLMISGFLGTLIGLERAVGIGKRWALTGPVMTALGTITLLSGLHPGGGALAITLGSLSMLFVFGWILRQQAALHTATMGAGALLWFSGNLLWLGGFPVSLVVPWWAGFLILTIAGERLELSRLLLLSQGARAGFVAALLPFLTGLVVVLTDYTLGWRLMGAGLLALALWLLHFDIARRTVRQAGLTRYIAICLLSGYVWLAIAGGLALGYPFLMGGPYDAVLHAIFLGFVFTMIFGHAPIIFPAILGMSIPYHRLFYTHLLLLHFSLILRVSTGLLDWLPGRQWSGILNMAAIVLFLFNTLLAVIRSRSHKSSPNPSPIR